MEGYEMRKKVEGIRDEESRTSEVSRDVDLEIEGQEGKDGVGKQTGRKLFRKQESNTFLGYFLGEETLSFITSHHKLTVKSITLTPLPILQR